MWSDVAARDKRNGSGVLLPCETGWLGLTEMVD